MKRPKPLAYIIDLDGTLYDNNHRQHLIPADKGDTAAWVAFNSACADDVLREEMADLVRSVLLSGREVIFLTGRGESAREPTMQRLVKDFSFIEPPAIIMRPMDMHSSAAQYKKRAVESILSSPRWGDYSLIALEDDPSIVEVMRGMGLTVLHVDSMCCAVQAMIDTAPAQFESLAGSYPVIPDTSEAMHVASVLEAIGSFESNDIDCDTVDLRFEVDGMDTGSDASITEYATRGAKIIRHLASIHLGKP